MCSKCAKETKLIYKLSILLGISLAMILNPQIKNVKVLLISKNNLLLNFKNNSIIIRLIKAIKAIKAIMEIKVLILEMEVGETKGVLVKIKVVLMGIMVDLEEIKEDLMGITVDSGEIKEDLMETLGILVVKVSILIKLRTRLLHTMTIV